MYIGFTGPSGRIENCYHAGGVANLNVDSDMPYVYEMMQDDFAINEIERSTPGTLTNCTTSPQTRIAKQQCRRPRNTGRWHCLEKVDNG